MRRDLTEAWAALAARPWESAAAGAALLAFQLAVLWGLPLLAVGLGWA